MKTEMVVSLVLRSTVAVRAAIVDESKREKELEEACYSSALVQSHCTQF
jgi:hypothetical protein